MRALTEGAMAAALGALLGSLVLYRLPQGGSVSLGGVLPVLVVALRRGPRVGFLAGAALGVLNFLVSPSAVVHPVQPVLDYPVAFAVLGLAGFLPGRPVTGAVLGGLGKLSCHVVTGALFFSSYAGDTGLSPWTYSMAYNTSVVVPDLVVATGLIALLVRKMPQVVARQDEGSEE